MSAEVKGVRVADFKALSKAQLTLGPFTVLTGANSSGKSSLLQSLMLLCQSVSQPGQIVLNGPLVRLGLPSDIVRSGQHTIQLTLDIEAEPRGAQRLGHRQLSARLSLAPDPDNSRLEMVGLEVTVPNKEEPVFAATCERLNKADRDHIATLHDTAYSVLRVTKIGNKAAPNRMYLCCQGFLPEHLEVHQSRTKIASSYRRFFGVIKDSIETDLGYLQYAFFEELNALAGRLDFLGQDEARIPTRASRPLSRGRRSDQWNRYNLAELDEEQVGRLVDMAAAKRSENEWVSIGQTTYSALRRPFLPARYHSIMYNGAVEQLVAEDYSDAISYISMISTALVEFGSSIRYLGPLRDEPRVVYGSWDERVDAVPVGVRGELTAEVLSRGRDNDIDHRDWTGTPHRDKLPAAIARWCHYLGIGDDIRVIDQGKLGRSVELRVNGTYRDLTMIGVGASQLLPVLVAGLTVAPGSVLLIEQPELHLHPLVQSHLADFFIHARSDVRFVVETHSEYIITRIRRRVAEGGTSSDSVAVLFAAQHGAATALEALAISELGDFSHWPDGFFDAHDRDVLKISSAVVSRMGTE